MGQEDLAPWSESQILMSDQDINHPVGATTGDIVPKISSVAVIGHIDHGKTSLLDELSGTSFATTELGGITQQVRSCMLKHRGHKFNLLDTPGHSAFECARLATMQEADAV
ncbi:MAG: GTP-binding protein, partial [Candidatus Hodgkinia cicadicola]